MLHACFLDALYMHALVCTASLSPLISQRQFCTPRGSSCISKSLIILSTSLHGHHGMMYISFPFTVPRLIYRATAPSPDDILVPAF